MSLAVPAGGWTYAKLQGLSFQAREQSSIPDLLQTEVRDGNGGTLLGSSSEGITGGDVDIYQFEVQVFDAPEWAVFGCAKVGVGSTGRWFNVTLDGADDASTASTLNEIQEEGEDTTEDRVVGVAARHKATGPVDLTLYGQEEAANGNMTDEGAYLIAIKGSVFADFEHDYTAGAVFIETTEATVATVGPYTPSVNGNHLVVGLVKKSSPNPDFFTLHLEDGTTPTRTGDSTPTHDQNWDVTKDEEAAYTVERISISAEKTYNLRSVSTGSLFVASRWLLVLNLNKPAGSRPFQRRQQTVVRM
jgi:hypothetical protein